MRINAINEQWLPMTIKGVDGLFNDMRIDPSSVPAEYHFWELADEDSDGTPCRYKESILVNFYGTFITKGDLPFEIDQNGMKYGYIEHWDDYSFGTGKLIDGNHL